MRKEYGHGGYASISDMEKACSSPRMKKNSGGVSMEQRNAQPGQGMSYPPPGYEPNTGKERKERKEGMLSRGLLSQMTPVKKKNPKKGRRRGSRG